MCSERVGVDQLDVLKCGADTEIVDGKNDRLWKVGQGLK